MQDIKRELIDSGSNTNNEISFEIRTTTLRPRLHTEGFQTIHYRIFHTVISTEELQLNTKVQDSFSLGYKSLHKREHTRGSKKQR